jgi:hypothetical protein
VRTLLWLKACDWKVEVAVQCNCTVSCILAIHLQTTVTKRRKQTGRNVAKENHGKGSGVGLHPKYYEIEMKRKPR